MKATFELLALGALSLAACAETTPSGTVPESAGSAGPAYCETVPSNPDDMEQWNKLCSPGRE